MENFGLGEYVTNCRLDIRCIYGRVLEKLNAEGGDLILGQWRVTVS
jgi:hypothetical protein